MSIAKRRQNNANFKAKVAIQGSQFTSEAFTGVLRSHEVKISMDGCGRFVDNIFWERLWRGLKYENVFPNCFL